MGRFTTNWCNAAPLRGHSVRERRAGRGSLRDLLCLLSREQWARRFEGRIRYRSRVFEFDQRSGTADARDHGPSGLRCAGLARQCSRPPDDRRGNFRRGGVVVVAAAAARGRTGRGEFGCGGWWPVNLNRRSATSRDADRKTNMSRRDLFGLVLNGLALGVLATPVVGYLLSPI